MERLPMDSAPCGVGLLLPSRKSLSSSEYRPVTKQRIVALYRSMITQRKSHSNVFCRALAVAGALNFVLVSAGPPMPARAAPAPVRQQNPALSACCTPSQVAAVEARLPVRPLNPQVIVQYVTHLRMVSVGLLPNVGEPSIHRPSGVNTIQYTFGFVPPSTGNLFVRPRPHFVQVIETVEQRKASGISITPVLGGVSASRIPAGYVSPLVLVVAQPARRLTFFIESNIPRNRLRLLGQLLTDGGRAPRTMTPLQALSVCERKSVQPYIYPQIVAVSGYLRFQRWKQSDRLVHGVLFGNGSVPAGTEYNSRWVQYGGLEIDLPVGLFQRYYSLTNPHPPIAWHGGLLCAGALSRLHVTSFDMPLPTAGG